MGDRTERVGMKPAPMNDRRADVAATVWDGVLVGRVLDKGERIREDESLWLRHELVCPEIARPQQLHLPTEETT